MLGSALDELCVTSELGHPNRLLGRGVNATISQFPHLQNGKEPLLAVCLLKVPVIVLKVSCKPPSHVRSGDWLRVGPRALSFSLTY